MVDSTAHALSARLRELRRARRRATAAASRSTRDLVVAAFAVPVVGMAIIAVLAAVVLLAAGSGMSGFTSAVGAIWLASHQVPVTVSDVTIGVLPLAPTIGFVAATTIATRRAAARGAEGAPLVMSAIAGPLVLTIVALALVMDGSTLMPITVPNVGVALLTTVAVHGCGALLGVGWQHRHRLAGHSRVATWAPVAVRGVGVGIATLWAAAAIVVVVRLLIRWHAVANLIDSGHGFAGAAGLTMLSILYLPNFVIGTAAALVGAQVHVGTAGGDLFASHGGSVPGLPIVAVVPSAGSSFAPLLLIIAVVAAHMAVRRAVGPDTLIATRTVAATAGLAAIAMVITGWIAGGQLGALGSAGVTLVTAGIYTFGWVAVIGMMNIAWSAVSPRGAVRRNDFRDGEQVPASEYDRAQGSNLGASEAESPGYDDELSEDAPADERDIHDDAFPADDSPTRDVDPEQIPRRSPAAVMFGEHHRP